VLPLVAEPADLVRILRQAAAAGRTVELQRLARALGAPPQPRPVAGLIEGLSERELAVLRYLSVTDDEA